MLTPIHAHVFSMPADAVDCPRGTSAVHPDYNYLLTPVQANHAMYEEAMKRIDEDESAPYTPEESAAHFTYRGINFSPPPVDQKPIMRWILDRVVRYRMVGLVDNCWGNVSGGDHCFFVIKNVQLTRALTAYVVTPNSSLSVLHVTPKNQKVMKYIPQLVAVRSVSAQLHPDQLMYDFTTDDGERVFGVGVPFYVGVCEKNNAFSNKVNDDVLAYTGFPLTNCMMLQSHMDMIVRTC